MGGSGSSLMPQSFTTGRLIVYLFYRTQVIVYLFSSLFQLMFLVLGNVCLKVKVSLWSDVLIDWGIEDWIELNSFPSSRSSRPHCIVAVNYVLSDREHADLVLNAEQVVDKNNLYLDLKNRNPNIGENCGQHNLTHCWLKNSKTGAHSQLSLLRRGGEV